MNMRNLVIWGVIVVVLIGLYSMMTGGGRGAAGAHEVTYSQLLSKVNAGEVKKAEIRGPLVHITDQSNKPFTSVTPNNQEDLVKRFEEPAEERPHVLTSRWGNSMGCARRQDPALGCRITAVHVEGAG